jgi:hypothetical protein
MGGVCTEQDFNAYLHSGADIVQVDSICFFDSHFPFKLRKFYDSQARSAARVQEDERDIALANFAKAGRSVEQQYSEKPSMRERIMRAVQEEMVTWLRRKDQAASVGPLRARPAPTVEECRQLIQNRLIEQEL